MKTVCEALLLFIVGMCIIGLGIGAAIGVGLLVVRMLVGAIAL